MLAKASYRGYTLFIALTAHSEDRGQVRAK